jgi:hypothetical protein
VAIFSNLRFCCNPHEYGERQKGGQDDTPAKNTFGGFPSCSKCLLKISRDAGETGIKSGLTEEEKLDLIPQAELVLLELLLNLLVPLTLLLVLCADANTHDRSSDEQRPQTRAGRGKRKKRVESLVLWSSRGGSEAGRDFRDKADESLEDLRMTKRTDPEMESESARGEEEREQRD